MFKSNVVKRSQARNYKLGRRISEKNHASQNRRQTAMVFLTELLIFMVLDTMAPRSKISKEKHASQNRRQTAMVFPRSHALTHEHSTLPHTHTHIHNHTPKHTHTYTQTRARIHTHARTHICTEIHTHAHAHAHAHTHKRTSHFVLRLARRNARSV